MRPSTGGRAFVQVKSRTDSKELADYIEQIDDGLYRRMFLVFHSGEVETVDERVAVIGPEKLAELVAAVSRESVARAGSYTQSS